MKSSYPEINTFDLLMYILSYILINTRMQFGDPFSSFNYILDEVAMLPSILLS